MQSTQRLRPLSWLEPGPGRSPWFMLLALMLFACIVFDIALVMSPDLSRSVIAAWRGLEVSGPSGPWVTLALRSGVAMGGAALGMFALVAFARGIASAPFVWLAPVLISFSTIIVARMPVELPLPISVQAYALASAFLLLGGGALLQVGRSLHVFVGMLITALPLGLLATSYMTPHAPALVTTAKLMLFVLAAGSVGVMLIAMLTPSASELFEHASLRREHEQRLAQAMQRVRASEERMSHAEAQIEAAHHSLRVQGAELEAALSIQDEANVLMGQRNRTLRAWLSGLIVVGSLGSLVGGYFMLYLPVVERVQAGALAITQMQKEQQQAQAQQVRASSESATLRAELAKAREQIGTATLALSKAETDSATYKAQLEAAVAATAVPTKTQTARHHKKSSKPQRTVAQRAAARAQPAREPKPSNSTQASDDSNDPIGGLDL